MNKYLFLDFDNTLAHTLCADNEKHADDLLYIYGEHWYGVKFKIRHDGWYVTFKRTLTNELLEFSRNLFGNENVFILTTGTLDYIRWCNVKLKLEFDPNTNIYGREDIEHYEVRNPRFLNSFNILVDNETYEYHKEGTYCKVNFLNDLPRNQYIKVPGFTVWERDVNDDYLDILKDQIVRVYRSID